MDITVLIVDDDEGVRFFHSIIVSQSMITKEPLVFKNAGEVSVYLNRHLNNSSIYLVLLDINMPGMDGWDFLNAISGKAGYREVYVVLVTSVIKSWDIKKAKSYSNVLDIVQKPISDDDLTRMIGLLQFQNMPNL